MWMETKVLFEFGEFRLDPAEHLLLRDRKPFEILESAPGRANVVARIEGTDPGAGALLVHGHLDVVPAEPADWLPTKRAPCKRAT